MFWIQRLPFKMWDIYLLLFTTKTNICTFEWRFTAWIICSNFAYLNGVLKKIMNMHDVSVYWCQQICQTRTCYFLSYKPDFHQTSYRNLLFVSNSLYSTYTGPKLFTFAWFHVRYLSLKIKKKNQQHRSWARQAVFLNQSIKYTEYLTLSNRIWLLLR